METIPDRGSRPHGHVAAVVGTMRKLGLPELLSTRRHRKRQLTLAMIGARILEPGSKLAVRHLEEGQRVLWNVTAVPFESHTCELAAFGRPDKGHKSRRQVLFGLLVTPEGVPVAVEVFRGHTGDPATVGTALDRVQERFGLRRVVLVGDRGMITGPLAFGERCPRIDEELGR